MDAREGAASPSSPHDPHAVTRGDAATADVAVAARGITKRFPGVLANDHVTFEVGRGEIHALLGENGAGKTTLCHVLSGLYQPDEGSVFVFGQAERFRSPRQAHAAGIFMVHQHFRLIPRLTVAENVVLGWTPSNEIGFSPRRTQAEVAAVAERYHIPVDPRARVWQLSVGEQQRVEILRALYRGARILILDEPTTVLTPQEVDKLFASLREMAAAGGTVIFISHKLPEVTAISDRVTVLRRGQSLGTVATRDTDPRALARLMVGREIQEAHRDKARAPRRVGQPVLEMRGVCARGDLGTPALSDVDLDLYPGEILGLAGVAGNGQRELAEVATGLRARTAGTVRIAGAIVRNNDVLGALKSGLSYVPEDRMGMGVAPGLTIADNLILRSYRQRELGFGPLLSKRTIDSRATALMDRFQVKAPGPHTLVRELSGGNIQRVLLARELSSQPKVLVAASPTRGLDVAATESVRELLLQAAESGVGVLLIDEDLDELLNLSDRIAVIYSGRVVGVVAAAEADREQIGLMMAGAA